VTRVLIVEDEPALSDSIRYGLEREGYECTVIADGSRAVEFVRSWRPDLVLLDLMLPGMPGTDVCREIRRIGRVPVVMVTAKDTEADKVVGLEMGADDYITKPFSMRELIARVRAVLRRVGVSPEVEERPTQIAAGSVEMDTERHEVRVNGNVIDLPPKEFALLEVLLRRAGKLMTREALIAQVWGDDYYGDTRTLDVHIKRLRSKIEADPAEPKHLRTVRGLGYRFET
jgi:two-component system, OmpR family, response regulator RegX3